MFPPLIWLAFVILVVAIIAIGGFIALRTGLWTRETSTGGALEDDVPTRGRVGQGPRFTRDDDADRPEHVTREDPTKARTIGT